MRQFRASEAQCTLGLTCLPGQLFCHLKSSDAIAVWTAIESLEPASTDAAVTTLEPRHQRFDSNIHIPSPLTHLRRLESMDH
jgi:hypothetical protein